MENTYSQTEKEIVIIDVHSNECMGCKRHKKDIMITYRHKNSDELTDLFLNTKQAENLLKRLSEKLSENKQS